MKTKYIAGLALVMLFGFAKPSIALGPGEMRTQDSFGFWERTEELVVRYNFTFRLAEGSDGIYPAAEVVEIEVPGELYPDGSQSSAFVISIPIGSFQEGPIGFFYTWNTPGLKVSQHSGSDVWDFVGSDGVLRFWAFIRVRDADEVADVIIRMRMTDNRNNDGTIEPAPTIVELLFGGPTLSIGNDRWETQVRGASRISSGT